jgi:hypothetical protein
MISGSAEYVKNTIINTLYKRKSIGNSLPLNPTFLILSENNGISALSINALKIEIESKTHGLTSNSSKNIESEYCSTSGKLNINNALAGVGKPMNESVWRVSMLKLAKR